MHKYALIIILLLPFAAVSQSRKLDFQTADSLSYQYYLQGEWKMLKELTREAFKQEIESKFMHQRAGYANYVTGDFYEAMRQYRKALEFDQSDALSREYLYYASLYAGSVNERYYASRLNEDVINKLGIKRFNAVSSLDAEFSIKTNNLIDRSNQEYYRTGIRTDLGYRVSLYQAYAYFEQTTGTVRTRQPEYIAILNVLLNPNWSLRSSYHHLFTDYGGINYPGNMAYLALSRQLNRFSLEANGSVLGSSLSTTGQVGVQAGVVLPGKSSIFLTSSLVTMLENNAARNIFAQSAGLKLTRKLWAKGDITFGNLKNYSTYSGLYIYNAIDPSLFRTGASLVFFLGKHLTLEGNFTFDQQEVSTSLTKQQYYQYSYSGYLKWKL